MEQQDIEQFHPLPVMTPKQALLPLVQAEAHVNLADPALAVFTDLRVAPGVTVPITESLEDTRRLMQMAGVRMAFVINAGSLVMGLVTLADLQGERPAQAARLRGVALRDLTVLDVMNPTDQWQVIDIAHVEHASVGDILATFHETAQRYLVVLERSAAVPPAGVSPAAIRGLFSANLVERALDRQIEAPLRSRSFAELAAMLT